MMVPITGPQTVPIPPSTSMERKDTETGNGEITGAYELHVMGIEGASKARHGGAHDKGEEFEPVWAICLMTRRRPLPRGWRSRRGSPSFS